MLKGAHWAPSCILKRQPQATRNSKEKGFIWQNKVQQHWNIINPNFCVILGMKVLISENAQGCSLGTLLYFEEATPSYKKQQRKKLHMTKRGSTGLWIGHLFMLFVFSIWDISYILWCKTLSMHVICTYLVFLDSAQLHLSIKPWHVFIWQSLAKQLQSNWELTCKSIHFWQVRLY